MSSKFFILYLKIYMRKPKDGMIEKENKEKHGLARKRKLNNWIIDLFWFPILRVYWLLKWFN